MSILENLIKNENFRPEDDLTRVQPNIEPFEEDIENSEEI
jgi:hypothetical protein